MIYSPMSLVDKIYIPIYMNIRLPTHAFGYEYPYLGTRILTLCRVIMEEWKSSRSQECQANRPMMEARWQGRQGMIDKAKG